MSVGEVSKAKDRKPAVRGVLLMRRMSSIKLALNETELTSLLMSV